MNDFWDVHVTMLVSIVLAALVLSGIVIVVVAVFLLAFAFLASLATTIASWPDPLTSGAVQFGLIGVGAIQAPVTSLPRTM